MTSNYLPDYIENAQDELELLVPALLRGELDRRTIVLLCDTSRQHGLPLTTVGDDQKVTSNAKAFYDAVGGGSLGRRASHRPE